jgi:hypothetical protein
VLIAPTSSPSVPLMLNPVQNSQPRTQTTGSSSPTTTRSSSSTNPSASGSSATGAGGSATSSSAGHVRAGGGGGGSAAGSAAAEVETLAGTYSTTVGGTQYAGSVEEENGSYTASVPSVNGATATGATMIEAENNLTIRIDELV